MEKQQKVCNVCAIEETAIAHAEPESEEENSNSSSSFDRTE